MTLALMPVEVEAAAVVGDFDDDVAAFVPGRQPDRALRRLAGGDPLGRTFDAVIGAVAHQVRERILDQIEHLAVELGIGAAHRKLDVLAELGAQVAHHARQFLPRIADRLHARLHHAFLQLGGDVGEPLQRHLEIGLLVAADDLEELIAGQHQFRDGGHQMIERVDIDTDRMVGEPVAALFFGSLGRGLLLFFGFLDRLGLVGFDLDRGWRRWRSRFPSRHAAERIDEIAVAAFRFLLALLDGVEDRFDPVDGGEDERDGFRGDRHAVAEFAHQRLGGMRQRFQPRQREKAARAFDGVNQAKNIAENGAVVRFLLEADEFGVDQIETLVGLSQEFTQQVVHTGALDTAGACRLAPAPLANSWRGAQGARSRRQARRA